MTIPSRGRPQDASELPVARAGVDGLRQAFCEGTTLYNQHVIEHYAIADRSASRARLATLVTKDVRKLRKISAPSPTFAATAGRTRRLRAYFRPSKGRTGPTSPPTSPQAA